MSRHNLFSQKPVIACMRHTAIARSPRPHLRVVTRLHQFSLDFSSGLFILFWYYERGLQMHCNTEAIRIGTGSGQCRSGSRPPNCVFFPWLWQRMRLEKLNYFPLARNLR